MKNHHVRISVCMATYNGERYILPQLYSILRQLSSEDEIVISDDGSKDNTINLIKSISDPRIRIIKNVGPHGYTYNFENALCHASGKYIFLSDQDDIWMDNKVEYMLNALKTYDFLVSNANLINSDGNLIADSYFNMRKPNRSFVGNILKCGYLGCCMAFKRCVLEKALPFPKDHVMCLHDNWLFLVGKFFFKTLIIKEKLISYRRHSTNVSSGGFMNTTTVWFKVKYRLYLLMQLFLRVNKPHEDPCEGRQPSTVL